MTPLSSVAFDALIDQTRTARRQLHALVERLQHERLAWERDAESLLQRPRLTASQRRRFRSHLVKLRGCRGR